MFKDIPSWIKELRSSLKCVDATTGIQQLKATGGVLIDVREPNEFDDAAANGSINIPRGVLEMKVTQLAPDANTPIFLHCATGGRATFAATQLVELGYADVTVITCTADTVIAASK